MEVDVPQVLTNIERMLRQRGYALTDPDRIVYEADPATAANVPSSSRRIRVYLCLYSKLNIERIKAYIQELESSGILHAIIVYDDVITSSCKKVLECMVRFEFETFSLHQLQFDITQHILYNPHERLSVEEVQQLNVPTKKFPIILKSDPVCRYFYFQKGDVIRVRRKDGVIAYRIVR